MDQHYSYCEKHDEQWHTMTNGDACPFCKLEKANATKPLLCDDWRDVTKENPSNGAFIIMWVEGGNGSPFGGYIYDGCFIDGIYYDCDGENKTPIAWMPRPCPPT